MFVKLLFFCNQQFSFFYFVFCTAESLFFTGSVRSGTHVYLLARFINIVLGSSKENLLEPYLPHNIDCALQCMKSRGHSSQLRPEWDRSVFWVGKHRFAHSVRSTRIVQEPGICHVNELKQLYYLLRSQFPSILRGLIESRNQYSPRASLFDQSEPGFVKLPDML